MARTAEILLYDAIGVDPWFGGGISAAQFAADLAALPAHDELVVRVNCPGGDVFDGYAIYNTLLQHQPRKVVRVEGLAASAASYIIQAGDEIQVAEASYVMVHDAWGMTVGNSADHLTMAAELEKFDATIAGIYARRSGRPVEEFRALMDAETWLTGQEAIDAKLADSLIQPASNSTATGDRGMTAAARLHAQVLGRYKHLPMPVAACVRAEGKVLSAANRDRAERIRTLAQEMLESSGAADASVSEVRNDEAREWFARAQVATMQAEIAAQLAAAN